MYSPQLGQFLSRDPLIEGQPDIFYDNNWFGERLTAMRNLYGYADNNPVNYTDPSGLACTGICFEIKKSKVISCEATNLTKKGCGLKTPFVTPTEICKGITALVAGQEGLKIDTCAGTEKVCGAPIPCSCQDKVDKKGQTIEKSYKALTIELEKQVKKGCFATFDLKAKIKVGEGWEGSCKPKKP